MKERTTLWQNRDFSLLFAAQTISFLGSGATTIGLALFARELAGDESGTAIVGNALTLRILAFLLFSQPAGVLADRFDRKTLLIATDVVRAGLLLLLPLATGVWHVYTLIFAINAVTAFFTPTYEASIPALVRSEHLVRALSMSRVAIDIENAVAPAIAALIVAVLGTRWLFRFDSMSYVLSAALVVVARVPSGTGPKHPLSFRAFFSEVTHGTRVILREATLRQSMLLEFVEATAGAAAIVGTVGYVRDVLQKNDSAVALAMTAVGAGSTLGAVVLGRVIGRYEAGAGQGVALHMRRHTWTRRAMLAGASVLGLALLPGYLVPTYAVLVGLWLLNGAGQAMIAIPSAILLSEHAAESERGRVYAAHFALTHACWLVTYPAIGHAAARWGAPMTFSLAGMVTVVLVVIAALTARAPAAHAGH